MRSLLINGYFCLFQLYDDLIKNDSKFIIYYFWTLKKKNLEARILVLKKYDT